MGRKTVDIKLPAPAAGADWTLTAAKGDCSRLLAVTATLTTAATVATRVPQLTFKNDNGDVYLGLGTSMNAVASTAVTFSYAVGLAGPWNATVTTGRAVAEPLPDLWLQPGDTVGPVTAGIQVADQWSAIVARCIVGDEWEHLRAVAELLAGWREHG